MPKEFFQQEYVKCGKASCRSCPHGPYWYAYRWEGAKTRKRYVGRNRPQDGTIGKDVAEMHPHDAIFSIRTASCDLAREILGIEKGDDLAAWQAKYRKLTKEFHPDRGGDETKFKRINAAWSYLISIYGNP